MKGFWVAGLAFAGVLLAGTAWAQEPGGGMGPGFGEHRPPMEKAFGGGGAHGRWWNNPMVAERLKLTDEQRKNFDGIFLTHREKLIDLRANLEKAELAMEPLMRDDSPNEASILAQIDKIAQARAELEKANARFLLAIRAKLTPEQWKLVQAYRASHEGEVRGPGRDGQRSGGWRQGGPGQGGQFHQQLHHQQLPPLPPPEGDGPQAPAAPPAAPAAPGTGVEQ
ncbi:MAG: Spy/CpxP family protein refolding chaperone [Terracidiphilus sp.]